MSAAVGEVYGDMIKSEQSPKFDPCLGAHALQRMAAFVLLFQEPGAMVLTEGPMTKTAVEVLRTARAWLKERDAGLGTRRAFAGDAVLEAEAAGVSLPRDTFAEILQQSALALLAPARREAASGHRFDELR